MATTSEQQPEINRQIDILSRGIVEIIPAEGLREKITHSLCTGRPLKVKLGLDPTAPDVHLGHTVVLRKLRQFQDLGHEVQLVIGDFTGRIGDPSGRSDARKQLTDAEVTANAKTYVEQFGKVMDSSKIKVHFNSEWLNKLNFSDVVRLSSQITVARMLERDDFEKRYKANLPISVHEFFYPLMQGYDSITLDTDIELGGTDQKFNLLMGRQLQEAYGQEKQIIMTSPLLEGLDGERKMSKSLGNCIGINETPNSIYGKTMSIPDHLMLRYFMLVTDVTNETLQEMEAGLKENTLHPRDLKMRLSRTIVTMYHGEQAGQVAEQHFVTVFQERALPEDINEAQWKGKASVGVVKLLSELGLTASNSEARRMIQSGAVRVNGERMVTDEQVVNVESGTIVQVGKRKIVRVRV
ncbi:MAG: tyrosyl-tRNA synthetase [Bacillota bacterium]|nr:MAG: tyrosyl-tRNA synthetase [Bacillota bacterium]